LRLRRGRDAPTGKGKTTEPCQELATLQGLTSLGFDALLPG
jgi:hypothetical protein